MELSTPSGLGGSLDRSSAAHEEPLFTSTANFIWASETFTLELFRGRLVVKETHERLSQAPVVVSTYRFSAEADVEAERHPRRFTVHFPYDATLPRQELAMEVGTEALRDSWVTRIQECLAELSAEGYQSASDPGEPLQLVEPPLNTKDVAPAAPGAERRDVLIIVRSMAQCAFTFLAYSAGYMVACRSRYAAVVVNMIAWSLCQQAYHIYPWAIGHPVVTFLVTFFVIAGNCALMVSARWLWETGPGFPDPNLLGVTATRSFFYSFTLLYGISGLYYAAWQRRHPSKYVEPQMGPRGCCQRDTRRAQLMLSIISWCAVSSVEAGSIFTNRSDTYNTASSIFYGILVCSGATLVYMGRRYHDEYFLPSLLRYLPTLSFGTLVCGRITNFCINFLRSHSTDSGLDTYLPLIFLLYKVMFMLLYPYFAALTFRMGAHSDQMKFMYPIQVLDAYVLDAFAIVSAELSLYHVFFVIVRIAFAVVYQAGLFRVVSDRIGLTARADTSLGGACNNKVGPDGVETPDLHALNRLPYGDTPLAQWLFFVQGAMAGALSVISLMIISAMDVYLPGRCVLTCGVRLEIVEIRATISFIAWLVTAMLTFMIARRRMMRAGFSRAELLSLTAAHLRKSQTVLMMFCWPIIAYMMDYTSGYIQALNGVTPLVTPL